MPARCNENWIRKYQSTTLFAKQSVDFVVENISVNIYSNLSYIQSPLFHESPIAMPLLEETAAIAQNLRFLGIDLVIRIDVK